MSVFANLDIQLVSPVEPEKFILSVIQLLLSFGWCFNDGGAITYLPIGDNDDFDWQRAEITDNTLLEILREKEKLGELIGVTMTWESSSIGGEFLFYSDGIISLNLSINRKKIKKHGYTDINWYIEKIIPVLNKGRMRIESFSYSEHV